MSGACRVIAARALAVPKQVKEGTYALRKAGDLRNATRSHTANGSNRGASAAMSARRPNGKRAINKPRHAPARAPMRVKYPDRLRSDRERLEYAQARAINLAQQAQVAFNAARQLESKLERKLAELTPLDNKPREVTRWPITKVARDQAVSRDRQREIECRALEQVEAILAGIA